MKKHKPMTEERAFLRLLNYELALYAVIYAIIFLSLALAFGLFDWLMP